MPDFHGFDSRRSDSIEIPELFFRELLPAIDDLNELKTTLYIFWRFSRMEGTFQYIRVQDIIEDERFLRFFGGPGVRAEDEIKIAIEKSVSRGTLLCAQVHSDVEIEMLYFLNDAKGQAAVDAINNGKWNFMKDRSSRSELPVYDRNIFHLYEENIGPLTPMISESLGDIEDSYPNEWIAEAIQISVENNKRSLKYIEAILKRWNEDGKVDRKMDAERGKSGREYIEGEYSNFVEH